MRIGVYPGTFDPPTKGHLDIIVRSASLVDKLVVGVATNAGKGPMFSPEERCDMVRQEVARIAKEEPELKLEGRVDVVTFDELLIEFTKKQKASIICRGLRAISDFEYEFQMSLTNTKLNPDITTIFLMPNEKFSYLNSSLVRELASYDASIKEFLPGLVYKRLKKKFAGR